MRKRKVKCGNCGRAFVDKENLDSLSADGGCVECIIYLESIQSKPKEKRQVTHYMAHDAGMPEMEGQ